MINILVDTALNECKECRHFEMEVYDNLFVANTPDTIICRCKYISICKNAINLYKKHKDIGLCADAERKEE